MTKSPEHMPLRTFTLPLNVDDALAAAGFDAFHKRGPDGLTQYALENGFCIAKRTGTPGTGHFSGRRLMQAQ